VSAATTILGAKREKRNLTFSSQEIKADELVRLKEPNILNATTGKVAGVQITGSTGAPGSSSRIVVRGVTSSSVIIKPSGFGGLSGTPAPKGEAVQNL
jgi:hypothetical protein